MKQIAMWAVLAGMIVTTSCSVTRSVNPLYTSKDLVTDAQLEGRWTDEDARDIWEVRQDDDGYVAAELGGAEPETVSVHVVAIGPSRFLDVAPRKTPSLAIEGHLFLKVHFEGEELVLQSLDWDWLQDKAAAAGLTQFEMAEKQRVLTAPTPDLQRFLAMYAEDPRAFDSDDWRLHRVR
jgi:hypothetical protein